MREIQRILRFLPETRTAFAYGSGIFQQQNHSNPSSNMLDLILIPNDVIRWHRENLKVNPNHYSFLKALGARRLAYIQENFGAGVYFNTMLKVDGRSLKYGVVSEHSLFDDLFSWKYLYLSGRLHKPVEWAGPTDPALTQAIDYNLNSALLASLLLLPEKFSEIQLYVTIASLSYVGDFRMNVGEDKGKVENIVIGNLNRFQKLYEHVILRNENKLELDKSKSEFTQKVTPELTLKSLKLLPENLQHGLVKSEETFHEDITNLSVHAEECAKAVRRQLTLITRSSSWSQSVKSVFTAGVTKSLAYASKKLAKHYKSL